MKYQYVNILFKAIVCGLCMVGGSGCVKDPKKTSCNLPVSREYRQVEEALRRYQQTNTSQQRGVSMAREAVASSVVQLANLCLEQCTSCDPVLFVRTETLKKIGNKPMSFAVEHVTPMIETEDFRAIDIVLKPIVGGARLSIIVEVKDESEPSIRMSEIIN